MNQERSWYQDGWTVIGVLFRAGLGMLFIYGCYHTERKNALPRVAPKISGRLEQPLFGSPRLTITVWHQNPGILRNGVLEVHLTEDPDRREESWQRQRHSFETWEPNQDHAVTFSFPLNDYDPHKEIRLAFFLVGRDIKPYFHSADWLGQGWKPGQDPDQPTAK